MGISILRKGGYVQSMKRPLQSLSVHIDRSARNGSTFEVPMKSVKEICSLAGVTRKTLFYYDRIGLLKPTVRVGTQAHKYYDEEAVETLQKIRLYKECGLKISEIRTMLTDTGTPEKTVLEYGIRRLRNTRTEIDERIFLVRLLQLTGVSSRMIRILSAFSSAEICRIGMAVLNETNLAQEMKDWLLQWPDKKELARLLYMEQTVPPQYRNRLKLARILSAENEEFSAEDRARITSVLQKENERHQLNEREADAVRQPLGILSMLTKEPADSEAAQLQAERIAVLLSEQGREEALDRIIALLCADRKETGISSYAETVLWIFWLKHAFAKTEGSYE